MAANPQISWSVQVFYVKHIQECMLLKQFPQNKKMTTMNVYLYPNCCGMRVGDNQRSQQIPKSHNLFQVLCMKHIKELMLLKQFQQARKWQQWMYIRIQIAVEWGWETTRDRSKSQNLIICSKYYVWSTSKNLCFWSNFNKQENDNNECIFASKLLWNFYLICM